jgi:transcriptional regulator with XRE-family HTH domain
MEHSEKQRAEDAPATPLDTIRARVKELRGRRGWSAAELGRRMEAAGAAWDRSIVANLEGGRRRVVTVDELLALGVVFDVAPAYLCIPLDNRPTQYVPGRVEGADAVRAWFCGEQPLPGVDEESYRREVSVAELRRRVNDPPATADANHLLRVAQQLEEAARAIRGDHGESR